MKDDEVPRLHTPRHLPVLVGRERHEREGLQGRAMHREPPLSIHAETGCAGDALLELSLIHIWCRSSILRIGQLVMSSI